MSLPNNTKKYFDQNPSPTHSVFYKLDENFNPVSYPAIITDIWDSSHVRMPCSPLSFHSFQTNEGETLISRWNLIENSLSQKVYNIYEMKASIMEYNTRFEPYWDFDNIIHFFENELNVDYKNEFFTLTYPGMVKLALDLPLLITQPIPLLKSKKSHSISLTQKQVASLLANAFFCTFPHRNTFDDDGEYKHFPRINFSTLFNKSRYQRNPRNRNKIEKLKCILHYFKRVVQHMPEGVVTYSRRVINDCNQVNWTDSDRRFDNIQLETHSSGSIFTFGIDSIKIDFANKYVGGGVLNNGLVQEEILFMTQPELLISGLFTEMLTDNECLVVQGTEAFVLHRGYANTFVFDGDFDQNADSISERDKYGRWKNTISMIDALHFRGREEQFTTQKILRELNKAYCGFSDFLETEDELPQSVSTGNWGCGAFRGDFNLKFIIQVMACAQLKKKIIYYTFNTDELEEKIIDIFQYLQDSNVTIGSLCKLLFKYCDEDKSIGLFDYIKNAHSN